MGSGGVSKDEPSADGVTQQRLRSLPAIDATLQRVAIQRLVLEHGRDAVLRSVRAAVDDARALILAGGQASVEDADIERRVALAARRRLRAVLNATGVLVHTNLGRSPLAPEAIEAVRQLAEGYATIEYDLERGERGDRHAHVVDLVRRLTGAEDAVVVNNNAAAVMLCVAAMARGREVLVSRGELVEIGGGFRIPDVIRESGAQLVEVGTTNRTHPWDYEAAITERTAALLKVHRSNFAMVGFVAEVSVSELAALARARGVPLVVDAGSGLLTATPALPGEATVGEQLAQGADVVTFSGDKLLGGPQAGLIAGSTAHLEKIRRHPLMRAMRPDKLCLAALEATLRLWIDAPSRLPIVAMLSAPVEALQRRAEAMHENLQQGGVASAIVTCASRVGGGASPLAEVESRGVRLACASPDALSAALRAGEPPIVARIEEGAVVLDLRTLPAEHDEIVGRAVTAASRGAGQSR